MPPRVITDRTYEPMVVDSHAGIKHRYDPKIASVIFALSSGGVPSSGVIYTVGLTWPTILKFYREALHAGRAMAEKKIAEKMFTLALKADSEQVQFQASKFWLSARAGWKETSAVELSTGAGNVPQISEDMTEEQAAEAYASMRKSPDAELIEGEVIEDAVVQADDAPEAHQDLVPTEPVPFAEPIAVGPDNPDPWAGFVDG